MPRHWWRPGPLAYPYEYPAITVGEACNCIAPDLISVEDADAYMEQGLKAPQWGALSEQEKQRALNSSQSALRTLRWCTQEETCCGRSLADGYLAAASELALALFSSSGPAVVGATTQLPAPVVKRQKLDGLEEEFFDPGSIIVTALPRDGRIGSYSPTVLRLYPWLIDLVGCWIEEGQMQASVPILRG